MRPRQLNDPVYWWCRAEEFRAKAEVMRDDDARRALLRCAVSAEEQARWLEAWAVRVERRNDE